MPPAFDPGRHCGAKNRSGGRCLRPKGWGTDHPRFGRCKFHGGATRNGRKQGASAAAAAALAELAVPIPTNPIALLNDLVDRANGLVTTAARMLAGVETDKKLSDTDAEARIRLLRETMQEAGRLAKMAAEAINEDTLVRVSVKTGEMIHRALSQALDAADVTGDPRQLAEETLARELAIAAPAGDGLN